MTALDFDAGDLHSAQMLHSHRGFLSVLARLQDIADETERLLERGDDTQLVKWRVERKFLAALRAMTTLERD